MNVAIAGAGGRMGRTLIEAVLGSKELRLSGALEVGGSPVLGQDAGQGLGQRCGVSVVSDPSAALDGAACLIDFTRPEGTLAHLGACVDRRVKMVIGTTGFTPEQARRIAAAAENIAIVLAPNMAVGVNVALRLAATAAGALGDSYDVEIIEAHHRHKVDAPSGTALKFGEVVAKALGRDLASHAVHGRRGETGERDPLSIGFHAIRGGDIVGEHTVIFAGQGERVEVSVRSSSRTTYASGALRAALFLAGRDRGLFDMQDVLGLR